MVVSFFLSWLAALIPTRLQARLNSAFYKIKRYADIINRHVITSSTDTDGKVLSVSSALCDISGYSPQEMIGKNSNIIRHPDAPNDIYEEMWGTIQQGKTWRGEIQDKGKDGNSFWLKHIITPDFDKTGEIVSFTSISHDISDKMEIERLSVTDGLTGLNNRRKLDNLIEKELGRFGRHQKAFAAILIDIDFFKQVNDNYGHKVGDSVLIKLAQILQGNTRKTDMIGRWGGEEFLIICPETSLSGAMHLAEKIRMAIEADTFPDIRKLTASFGVTCCHEEDTADDIFLRSDKALYLAKEQGRNRVVKAIKQPLTPSDL